MAHVLTVRDYHIGEGGPLRRLETRAHLTNLRRQIVTALAAIWMPMVLFGLLTERLTGHRELLFRNLALHVRLSIALPVFLLLDQLFPRACRRILGQLIDQSFVPAAEHLRLERLLRGATRLTDAVLVEPLLAVFALAIGVAALLGVVPIGALTRGTPLSASKLWYAIIAWPLFQFLLWRSLWRWAIWGRILIGLSRMNLELVPTHPDRRGGIRFLGQPSVGYCALFLFAVSSVLSAEWGGTLTFATIRSFEPIVLAFAIVGLLVAFGPLLFFVPRLERARLAALLESSGVAAAFGRRFRRQYLEKRNPEAALDADPAPLAHMTKIHHDTVERLLPFLFDLRDVIVLLVATLLPVVPVMLAHIPSEDWGVLLKLLTGGRF